jgi:8-oxo-dGTP diphosphatase
LLDVHRVSEYAGEPHGREGQPLAWLHPEEMTPADFPAADRPIINALRLPALYLITGENPLEVKRFLRRLEQALEAGIRIVQLRAHGLEVSQYRALAEAACGLCEQMGACLVLNRPAVDLPNLLGHGLHFSSRRLMELKERPADTHLLLGASCHNREQLQQAERLGFDYALLSPVLPTASHPDAKPLGWEQFADLVEEAGLPVYALGGLGPRDMPRVRSCYGQGIAAIRGLWPADDPENSN